MHDWPGNIRELQNAVRQAVVLHDGETIERTMLDPLFAAHPDAPTTPSLDVEDLRQAGNVPVERPSWAGMELWEIEKQAIETTIDACGGSVPKAAKMLGVSPSTIYRKREAWEARSTPPDLDVSEFRPDRSRPRCARYRLRRDNRRTALRSARHPLHPWFSSRCTAPSGM